MKLYIQIFKDNKFGNFHSDILILPNNHLKVYTLKQIIQEKYGIEESNQRLTTKICNRQFITMTNDFPLNFYFIRDKSIIYIEFIEKSSQIKEVNKIISQSIIKNKYLNSIGIINNFPMRPRHNSIISASNNNINNSKTSNNLIVVNKKNSFHFKNKNFLLRKIGSTKDFRFSIRKDSKKEIIEKLNKAILGNKLDEFIEIMDNRYEFIDINSYLDNSKYAAIHYAAMYGYVEMMKTLINRYRVNVNLISIDKWSALHLAAYKGHIGIVNILLQCKEINFNLCIDYKGTPLHCACKRNNFKIVSLLLHKCDPLIKNFEGLLPINMTNEPSIKKIINKIINKNYGYNINNESGIKNNEDVNIKENHKIINISYKRNNPERKMDFINFTFLKDLKQIPNQPPIYNGFIYKKGNKISHFNSRLIEINPIKGFLLIFINKEDFPNKPNEVILLKNIKNIRKIEEQNYFYIELIIEEGNHLYRFQNILSRNEWYEAFNNCIHFKKYWIEIEKRYAEASVYLNFLKQEIMEINYQNGQIEKKDGKKRRQRRNEPYMLKKENKYNISQNNILNSSYIGFNSFELLDSLGEGSFGKVFKVRMKSNGEIYAMKVINKYFLIKNHQLKYAITECNVLQQVNSPFILTLHYSFQTEKNLYMIIDYCPGGDLNFHIIQNVFEENEAKFYIAELILGIEHLHKLNIIYRDLKPENILINSDNHIKLADFGLAKEGVNDSSMTKSFCGSPAYLSPEMIIRKGAGKSADMYGIGAVLYEMIRGTPPFYSNNIRTLYKNITQSKLILPDFFSIELKDLLKQLLCKDPYKRIGVLDKTEIKNHIWFKDFDWDKIAKKEIKPPIDLVKIKKDIEKDNIDDNLKKKKIDFKDIDYPNNKIKNEDMQRIAKFTFVKPDKH